MNMKKIKKFFTLSRRAEGFTLVELIVVIAILAILGGVAVPAYSGYVKKANMTADQTLVSEVAKALQLQYYTDPTNATVDYVILSTSGAKATADGRAAKAMQDAFGSNWQEAAALKYGEWSDDGLMSYVLENAGSAGLIANSTYLTKSSPEALMKAATNLTDAASSTIKNYAEKYKDDPNKVEEKLNDLLGPEFVANLNATGVKSTDPEYTTVISNMLVGHYSNNLHGADADEVMADEGVTGMLMQYATLYAYCETIGDTTTMAEIDTYLASSDSMDDLSTKGFNDCLNNVVAGKMVGDKTFMDAYLDFNLGENRDGEGGKLESDVNAALEIMGAVDLIAGTYKDKASLSDPNLYTSASVGEQLNNYINAIKAVSDGLTIPGGLPDGAVAILISKDGSVSVLPGVAYLVK